MCGWWWWSHDLEPLPAFRMTAQEHKLQRLEIDCVAGLGCMHRWVSLGFFGWWAEREPPWSSSKHQLCSESAPAAELLHATVACSMGLLHAGAHITRT